MSIQKTMYGALLVIAMMAMTTIEATKLILTAMPQSIPGEFTVFEYDTETQNATALISGQESSYTAYDFVSGAAVCGSIYYTVWTDVPLTYGIAAFDLKQKKTLVIEDWSKKENNNLVHNIWCDPSDTTGKTLLAVQSTMQGTVNEFSVHRVVFDADKKTFESTQLADLKGVQDRFFGVDYEFSLSSDGSELWSLWTNSHYTMGTLVITNLKTGKHDHVFTSGSGQRKFGHNVGYLASLGVHGKFNPEDTYMALFYKYGKVGSQLNKGEFKFEDGTMKLITHEADVEDASDMYVTSMPPAICEKDALSYVIQSGTTTNLLIIEPKELKKQELRTLKLEKGKTSFYKAGGVACVNN